MRQASRFALSRHPLTRALTAAAIVLATVSTGLVTLAAPAGALPSTSPTITASPSSPARDPRPTWTFDTDVVGATGYECAVVPFNDTPAAWVGCSGSGPSATYRPPTLSPDGSYAFFVRAVDTDGPGPAAKSFGYSFDTTATATVVPVENPTSNKRPTWTIVLETTTSTATCDLGVGPPVVCAAYDSGTSTFASFTPSADLPDGSTTLTVRVTDDLNNINNVTSSVTVDTAGPTPAAAPVATSTLVPAGGTVAWTWAPNADVATAACVLKTAAGVVVDTAACTSLTGYSHPSTGLADDAYDLQVTVADALGNGTTSTSALTERITYDGTAPGAPVLVSSPVNPRGTSTSAGWTFTTPGDATTCTLSSPSRTDLVVLDCQATGSGPTYQDGQASFSGLADGTWTLDVATRDLAGNITHLVPGPTYTVDTTGPTVTSVTGGGGLHKAGDQPTFAFTTAETGSYTAQCRLAGTAVPSGTDLSTAWSACAAGTGYPQTLTQDGTYSFEVILSDDLLNAGATASSATYTYDGTAPMTPNLSGTPLAGQSAPTYTFTVEPTGSATCTLYDGLALVETVDCSGGSYPAAMTTDSAYTVGVVVSDAAGNTSSATRTFTLDRVPPPRPDVTGVPATGNSTSVTWQLDGHGDTLTCTLSPGGPTAAGCGTSFAATLTSGDVTYTLTVTATDVAGNTSSTAVTYLLDTGRPVAPTVTSPASPDNTAVVVWSFSQEPGATAECRLTFGSTVEAWQDCTGGGLTPNSYTRSNLADDTYLLEVRQRDAAQNLSDVGAGAPYRSDRTLPGTPTVSGPTGRGNTPSGTWSWSVSPTEPGATAACRLDRDGVAGTAVACNGGSFATSLTADGDYTVVVVVTDAAHNVGAAGTSAAYTLDTAAPAPPVVIGPTGPSNDTHPTWSFATEPDAHVECQITLNGTGQGWQDCASGQARTLVGDGSYVLEVRQTDVAGNTSPVGSGVAYALDTSAPAQSAVIAPASPSADQAPSWVFTSEAGGAAECRLLRGTSLIVDWAACTSPVGFSLTAVPDGGYVVEVRVTDPAANTGLAGQSQPYVLDTTAPDQATVSGPSGPSPARQPSFTWTGESGTGAQCQLVLDGVLQGSAGVACFSPYAPTLTSDGDWALSVVLLDLAGNRSLPAQSGVYVYDTTAPLAPVISPPTSPGRTRSPSWSAAVESGATTECRVTSGPAVLGDWATCTLPYVMDLTGQGDATYDLSVRATDAAGLVSPVGTASYVLDTTVPAAPVFASAPSSPSRSRTGVFAITTEPLASLTCRLTRGPTVIEASTTCASPVTVTLTGLPDGAYTLTAFATDQAGNAGPAATSTYVLDTAAPAAPVLLTGPAALSPDRTPTWDFTAEPGTTLTCRITGATTGIAVADAVCTSPFTPAALSPDDTYTLSVRATDAAGNTGPALTNGYVLDGAALPTANVTGPASPGRSTTPTWLVSAQAGTVQCRLVKDFAILRDWQSCGPTYASNLVDGDGLYVLYVRVQNGAGAFSSEVLSRYTLDTTAPALAALTAPPSPGTDRAPTWSVGTTDLGATATCQVLAPDNSVLRAFASCPVGAAGSPYRLDLTGAVDGAWTLQVRLTDLAGNVGAVASSTYLLDTGAPNTVLVTGPRTPDADATPTWGLVGDTDAVLECRLTGPGLTSLFTACAPTSGVAGQGSFTADLTTAADGTYSLTAHSRDAAGNLGPDVTSTYALDRVAPAAPSVPVAPPSPARVPAIDWTFTVEAGSTALCTLTTPVVVVSPETPCTSPWTTDLGRFGDGDYGLTVRSVDPAGNYSPAVTSRYVLDRTPSAAPSITGSPAGRSPDPTPTWHLALADPEDALECQLLGTAATWAPCSDPATFDLAPATAGTFSLQVREVDDAGNVSDITTSSSYVLDPTAPWTVEVAPPAPQRSNALRPVFTIVRQAGDTTTDHLLCQVSRFDGGPATVTPCAFGPVTADLTLAPALNGDGDVRLFVRTVTASGVTSVRATAAYHFDNVPPAVPGLLPLTEDHGFGDTVSWTFASTDRTDRFVCQLTRAGTVGALTLGSGPCTSPWSVTLPSTGAYTLAVAAIDLAGNTSAGTADSSYAYLPPVPSVATPRGPGSGVDASPTWTFTVPRGFRAVCSLSGPGGVLLDKDADCRTGTYTAALPETSGTYSLSVTLLDSYGNRGLPTRQIYRFTPAVVTGHLGSPATPSVTPGNPGRPGVTGKPPIQPPPPLPGTPTTVVTDPVAPHSPPPVGRTTAGAIAKAIRTLIPTPAFDQVPRLITKAISDLGRRPTIPLVLLSLVVGFLLLQNRIDRRDPKLASAPVGPEPELDFGPMVSRMPLPGGAHP